MPFFGVFFFFFSHAAALSARADGEGRQQGRHGERVSNGPIISRRSFEDTDEKKCRNLLGCVCGLLKKKKSYIIIYNFTLMFPGSSLKALLSR